MGGPGGPTAAASQANVGLAREMAEGMGWSGSEWAALQELWMRESGFDHTAVNSKSGATGIPQLNPNAHSIPANWSDPATQIRWGLDYIAGRYTTPSAALAFHDVNNSYRTGGDFIAHTPQMIGVGEGGGSERVTITPMHRPGAGASGGTTVVINSTVNAGTVIADDAGIAQLTEAIGEQMEKDLDRARIGISNTNERRP